MGNKDKRRGRAQRIGKFIEYIRTFNREADYWKDYKAHRTTKLGTFGAASEVRRIDPKSR